METREIGEFKNFMKRVTPSDAGYGEFLAGLKRRAIPDSSLSATVAGIVGRVAAEGDGALIALTEQFDRAKLSRETLFVTEEEKAEARAAVSEGTKRAVAATLANIHAFAEQSLRRDWSGKNAQGAWMGERFTPFSRVGVYVPGGKAPLVSTALMTAGFAQAAGVPEILAATPCNAEGKVNAELLYALLCAGATEILKVGGAQGIAAMALGTESVRPVELIVGPGNRFVVEAKRQLVGAVAIDLLPGPSEIMLLADETGNAAFLAADLLAQAEHGGDSVVAFLTTSEKLLDEVEAEIERQVATLSRGKILKDVLEKNASLVLVESMERGVELVNAFAPEHLTLVCENQDAVAAQIRSAGAIYLGNFSVVAVGDFLAGPSHTLPTGGAGHSFSGLRADHFQRRTSWVKMDEAAVAASVETTNEFSRIEGLDAHGRSVSIRLEGSF